MARFLGSARYLRMYSRCQVRLSSARQASEQYDRCFPGPLRGSIAPPQTQQLFAAPPPLSAPGAREPLLRRRLLLPDRHAARLRLRRAFFRHSSEQYRTARWDVSNSRPHPPHRTRRTLAISAATSALHASQ